jgi:hypothetical protein
MRYITWIACWALLCAAAPALAQQHTAQELKSATTTEFQDLSPTTAMSAETWVYLQEYRKQEDPQTLIFRRALQKAENRRRRLESLAWYGYSNLRPTVNPVPMTSGSYSAYWGANTWDPFRWSAAGASYVVIIPR